jgi:hypothetical protein
MPVQEPVAKNSAEASVNHRLNSAQTHNLVGRNANTGQYGYGLTWHTGMSYASGQRLVGQVVRVAGHGHTRPGSIVTTA